MSTSEPNEVDAAAIMASVRARALDAFEALAPDFVADDTMRGRPVLNAALELIDALAQRRALYQKVTVERQCVLIDTMARAIVGCDNAGARARERAYVQALVRAPATSTDAIALEDDGVGKYERVLQHLDDAWYAQIQQDAGAVHPTYYSSRSVHNNTGTVYCAWTRHGLDFTNTVVARELMVSFGLDVDNIASVVTSALAPFAADIRDACGTYDASMVRADVLVNMAAERGHDDRDGEGTIHCAVAYRIMATQAEAPVDVSVTA